MKFLTLVLLALMASPAAWAEGQGAQKPAHHRRVFAAFLEQYTHPAQPNASPSATRVAPQRTPPPARAATETKDPPKRVDPRVVVWKQMHPAGHGAPMNMALAK